MNHDLLKIGVGYDVHRLSPGRKLMLGCVHFEDAELGLVGHSDADVVSHAVCDALLGALGVGDIGDHFPDTHPEYRGYPGARFIQRVTAMVHAKGFEIANVDCVVMCDAVKLGPRKKTMAVSMAGHMDIAAERVNVKATTFEGRGAVGRNEVIACEAVAMLCRS